MQCNNCPCRCSVGRYFCRKPQSLKINIYQLHYGEEPCISGTRGSGTVFFSHCNLRCVFCQNYKISQLGSGTLYTQKDLIDICWELTELGAHNINFVTPTPYTDILRSVMKELKRNGFLLPFVWNCGGYESLEAIKSLDGLVDIYMPDFKYAMDDIAVKYSSAPGYAGNAAAVIKEMRRQVRDVFYDDGVMKSGLLIRHLILPGNIENSKAVLRLIKEAVGTEVMISLMSQFFPAYKACDYTELSGTLSRQEYDEVYRFFIDLGFEEGYLQGMESASDKHVPEFK